MLIAGEIAPQAQRNTQVKWKIGLNNCLPEKAAV